jgi:secondary thiamine-phosphate synthase enzyme
MDGAEIRLTTDREWAVDVSWEVQRFVEGKGDGLCHVFLPHATAGLALIELGSGSEDDLAEAVERLLPRGARYRHAHGSPGHGADHLLPAFVSPSLVLPVRGGELVLGRWQRVVVIDPNVDNPERRLLLSFWS